MEPDNEIKQRKAEHVEIVLDQSVIGSGITTGLEQYRFLHQALPELDYEAIDLTTTFLGRSLQAPLLISSMTGGTEETGRINRTLAKAAQARGWALGLGSMRVAIENPEIHHTFQMRNDAPDIPILVNLGAVQLNKGVGIDECRRIVDIAEADGLILHLNSMQEVFQPAGDTNFAGLLSRIEQICKQIDIPVGIKEVGWGIHGKLAKTLYDCGIHFVDVAGAGGTSWSQVESYRTTDALKQAAQAFLDWGIPTADCIRDVRNHAPDGVLIASGGLKNGVDAAKTIALGANLAGFGRNLLRDAVSDDPTPLTNQLSQIELELKLAMFGAGSGNISALQQTKLIKIND
jgi:isopentenyl-diphosphate delta-isomerase